MISVSAYALNEDSIGNITPDNMSKALREV